MTNSQEIIFIEAGEKIELFNRRFSSVPMCYEFLAKTTGPKHLSGLIEIHRKKTVFSSPIQFKEINPNNAISASMWDTFMTIYVIAECDMEISVPKRKVKSFKRVMFLVLVLILVASSIMLLR